jgi:hypothetical protein
MKRLTTPVLAFMYSAIDTGAVASSGGDIQYSASGLTPQGNATAVNAMILATATKLD